METSQLVRGARAPSAERIANRAAGVEAVRRYLRGLDLRGSAVFLVSEAWSSPMDEYGAGVDRAVERDEALVACVVTSRFGRIGVAEIRRDSGVPDSGPGVVGEFAWETFAESAPLTDGIFACLSTAPDQR